MGRALQPPPAPGQTAPCLFILLISEVMLMGACLSNLLHLSQAVLGLELLLHLPPLHHLCSLHAPAIGCSLLSPLHTCPKATPASLPAITNSSSKTLARGSGVFSRHVVSPSNECYSHPAPLAVTILVTPSLPWCQGMFSAIKVTSTSGTMFSPLCSHHHTASSMALVFGCSWQRSQR